eukprot:SM000242S08497  [mRNA]  locus=s242:94095:96841:- [translate_table: standard]
MAAAAAVQRLALVVAAAAVFFGSAPAVQAAGMHPAGVGMHTHKKAAVCPSTPLQQCDFYIGKAGKTAIPTYKIGATTKDKLLDGRPVLTANNAGGCLFIPSQKKGFHCGPSFFFVGIGLNATLHANRVASRAVGAYDVKYFANKCVYLGLTEAAIGTSPINAVFLNPGDKNAKYPEARHAAPTLPPPFPLSPHLSSSKRCVIFKTTI